MEITTPSFESKSLKSPEEELNFLREQLAQKEREVASLKIEKKPEEIHKETINEYKQIQAAQILHKDYVMPVKKAEEIVLQLTPEEHDNKISELLGIMQTQGIKNVLSIIEKMNDPHIQDDFEDF